MRLAAISLVLAVALAGCSHEAFRDGTRGPGGAARDLVSARDYAKLVVEIDSPPGNAPNSAALDALRASLRELTAKSSIEFVQDSSVPTEAKKYSFDEIRALEERHRDRRTGGDTAALYILYVAGGAEDDTDEGVTLGALYGATSIVMFKGNIKANSGGALSGKPSEQALETAVLRHEFGHAAGLVDLGAEMQRNHEDPEHEGHSSNPESVMYWAVENTAGLLGLLDCGLAGGGTCGVPQDFDADDRADLAALREG